MLRLNSLTETLDKLPQETRCQIFVTYSPDAPRDYEPPFFSEFQGHAAQLQFSENSAFSCSLGKLKTPFHAFSLKMRFREDLMQIPEDVHNECSSSSSSSSSSSFIVPSSIPVSQISKRSLPSPPKLNRRRSRCPENSKGAASSTSLQYSLVGQKRSFRSPSTGDPAQEDGKRALKLGNICTHIESNSDNDFTDTDDRRRQIKSAKQCQQQKKKRKQKKRNSTTIVEKKTNKKPH